MISRVMLPHGTQCFWLRSVAYSCRFLCRASLEPRHGRSSLAHAASAGAAADSAAAATQQVFSQNAEPAQALQESAGMSMAQTAGLKPGQAGQQGSLLGRATTWGLSERLDFAEFLQRQNSHLQVRTFTLIWHMDTVTPFLSMWNEANADHICLTSIADEQNTCRCMPARWRQTGHSWIKGCAEASASLLAAGLCSAAGRACR